MDDTIKLAQLRVLAEAQAVAAATLTGRQSGWTLSVQIGETSRVLCSADGSLRVFSTTDSAIAQMKRIGITRIDVVADAYEAGTLRAPRPDRAVALKEAADYAAWLKTKVQRSIDQVASGEARLYSIDEARTRVAEARKRPECGKKRSP